MTGLIEARNVRQVFGAHGKSPTVALSDLSLTLDAEAASFTAVVGESGSGKTTLARILLGFQRPSGGEVRYLGESIHPLTRSRRQRFRRDVQAIFQDPFEVYNPFYKVDHLLDTPMKKFGLANSRREAREKIDQVLQDVGLEPAETLGRYPHQLSGGQRQRLTVARALLVQPRLIIADEPVSMVDASLRATILASLRHLNENFGISFVYITHDLATAYQVSTNIIVLYHGMVMEAGEIDKVIGEPQHPYTQLLVESVPVPDPTRGWGGEGPERDEAEAETSEPASQGCPFAARCPHVMDVCRREQPPLYRVAEHQASACFLHQEVTDVVNGDVTEVFRRSRPAHDVQRAGYETAQQADTDTQGD